MTPRVLIAAALLACSALHLNAAPPTDEQITQAIQAITKAGAGAKDRSEMMAARSAAATEAFKDLSLKEATLSQLEQLGQARVLQTLPDRMAEANARAAELAKDSGPNGAAAAEVRLGFVTSPGMDRAASQAAMSTSVIDAIKHPGMLELLKSGKGGGIFNYLGAVDPAAFKSGGGVAAAEQLLVPELSTTAAMRAGSLFEVVADEDFGADRATIDRIRTRVVGLMNGVAERSTSELQELKIQAAANAEDKALAAKVQAAERTRDQAQRQIKYLSGAWARGALQGQPAPDITFSWATPGMEAKKLSDLRGKVVVVDFWATWCGPCVGSFPQVRSLAAHYQGYPVVVLGVTSIQGSITKWADGRPAGREDTKDNPAKEVELLGQWVKDMDVTWPVVVGTDDVFNPEYGVRGIPHVVIIDPKGVVRHRGLHPASEPAKKHGMINAILKEFNLPAPAETPAKDEPAGG